MKGERVRLPLWIRIAYEIFNDRSLLEVLRRSSEGYQAAGERGLRTIREGSILSEPAFQANPLD